MRRHISMLAAGLFAAGTVVTGGIASAGTTAAHHQTSCIGGNFFHVVKSHVSYFLGTPNNTFSGAAAILKPSENGSTAWTECIPAGSNDSVVLENRGLALTSRSSSSGANVTLETPGNDGNGFASQQWFPNAAGPMIVFENIKTGLSLRVRNGGPVTGQTVTTGTKFTVWLMF
jgi:hypothetical protein